MKFITTIFAFAIAGTAYAADTTVKPYLLEPGAFPGLNTSSPDLGSFLASVFNFAIAAAVALTLVMIIIGGIEYMTTDAWDKKEHGKERIWGALKGLGLALVSWLILYTINPCLVDFFGVKAGGCKTANTLINPPAPVQTGTTNTGAPGLVAGTGQDLSCGTTSYTCQVCQDCINLDTMGVAHKYPGQSLNSDLARRLANALAGVPAQITEGWPPTTDHISTCHQNGRCADVNLFNQNQDPAAVKQVYDALVSQGLQVIYEADAGHCSVYTAAGVNCTEEYDHTAPSFHVHM